MDSLPIAEAALSKVKAYNPDLEIDILLLNERNLQGEDLIATAAHIRSALVARIADTVNHNASQEPAMDAAVAMVELLVNSYATNGCRPGNHYKHAMQAISLLASSGERLDIAMDLFFDLVDRFYARAASEGHIQMTPAPYSDAFARLQKLDQTFVMVFLSKLWVPNKRYSTLNLNSPLQRIRMLQRECKRRGIFNFSCTTDGSANPYTSIFADSIKVLRRLQKRQITDSLKSWVSVSNLRELSLTSRIADACRRGKARAVRKSVTIGHEYSEFRFGPSPQLLHHRDSVLSVREKSERHTSAASFTTLRPIIGMAM